MVVFVVSVGAMRHEFGGKWGPACRDGHQTKVFAAVTEAVPSRLIVLFPEKTRSCIDGAGAQARHPPAKRIVGCRCGSYCLKT